MRETSTFYIQIRWVVDVNYYSLTKSTTQIDTVLSKLNKKVQVDKMILDRAHEVGLRDWDASMGMMGRCC